MRNRIKLATTMIIGLSIILGGIINHRIEVKSKELKELTIEEKLEDFRYMYEILKDNYVYFDVNKRVNEYDWLSHKEEFENNIKNTKNNLQFYNYLQESIGKLNDRHTNILTPDFYEMLLQGYSKSIGARIELAKVLEKSKGKYEKWNTIVKQNNSINTNSSTEGNFNDNKNAYHKILEDNKIAYLRVPSMMDRYINEDKEDIYNFLLKIKDYPYLIIDITGNEGGSTTYWIENIVAPLTNKSIEVTYNSVLKGDYSLKFYKPMYKELGNNIEPIEKISKKHNYPPEIKDFRYFTQYTLKVDPINPVGFHGEIFLLVDWQVFSSSDTFAGFSKYSNWATLVGNTTAGDGVGMDPIFARLPNSGLVLRFAGSMGLNPDGSSSMEKRTSPDIMVNGKYESYEDYRYSILKTAISYINR